MDSGDFFGKIFLLFHNAIDSFDEENDFRLYQDRCDAYNYLTNSALNKDTEVGAYITDRGIIIGPNSRGGPKSYTFDRGLNVYSVNGNKVYDYSNFFLTSSNMGLLNVKGFIHTHPGSYSIEPSGEDKTFASFGYADHFIIGTRDGMIQAALFGGGGIISSQLINNFKQTQGCN